MFAIVLLTLLRILLRNNTRICFVSSLDCTYNASRPLHHLRDASSGAHRAHRGGCPLLTSCGIASAKL